jgi:hypothetical protein
VPRITDRPLAIAGLERSHGFDFLDCFGHGCNPAERSWNCATARYMPSELLQCNMTFGRQGAAREHRLRATRPGQAQPLASQPLQFPKLIGTLALPRRSSRMWPRPCRSRSCTGKKR